MIEVTSVGGMPYLRNNRTFHLPIIKCLPVNTLEEWMGFDAINAARYITKPVRRVYGAQSANEISGLRGYTAGVTDPAFDNSVQALVSFPHSNEGWSSYNS